MTKPGTMTGKEAFMQNIARRLGRSEPLREAPARMLKGVPEFYRDRKLHGDELVEEFSRNWMALSGKVLLVGEAEAAVTIGAYAREICKEHGIERAARWDHPELNKLGLDETLAEDGIAVLPWRPDGAEIAGLADGGAKPDSSGAAGNWARRSALLRAAETCRLGIVWPDVAIANTATLALFSHGGKGRSVSLLTDALLAVFRADQLVTRMGEAFERFKAAHPTLESMPSSLNLITGPSRSADIENDLTIGIHGPGKVYAVIIRP
ncbi:LUD domain-containing protein [Paenibacillus cisolokensis]|uniref:LutC/YkgG family protein n=1 Tax=Paenibacillus cisolokensis TaxID=1658519 RepID=UPI003D27C03A